MSVNGPISPKQCYYEMDYLFYSFYSLDSLEIRLDHNSTYYRSLSKNSDVKHLISHCDSQNLQYKTHPEFWPSQKRIFKTSLYYKTRLILETRRYIGHWLMSSLSRRGLLGLTLSHEKKNGHRDCSRWAHIELTVSSRWQFFFHGMFWYQLVYCHMYCRSVRFEFSRSNIQEKLAQLTHNGKKCIYQSINQIQFC